MTERIIAADIGATKTLIGIFEGPPGRPQEVVAEQHENGTHPDLGSLLSDFLHRHGATAVDAACIAFPGPVSDGRAQGTNIAWAVDRRDLAAQLATPRVQVVNDLVAAARGMLLLPETAFMALNPGADTAASGNAAVLAVGTGLGQAILHWDEDRFRPIACEGSHADFAAQSEQEIALLRYMQARHGAHVSWERVVSGPGLVDIHAFLRGKAGDQPKVSVHELLLSLSRKDNTRLATTPPLSHETPNAREDAANHRARWQSHMHDLAPVVGGRWLAAGKRAPEALVDESVRDTYAPPALDPRLPLDKAHASAFAPFAATKELYGQPIKTQKQQPQRQKGDEGWKDRLNRRKEAVAASGAAGAGAAARNGIWQKDEAAVAAANEQLQRLNDNKADALARLQAKRAARAAKAAAAAGGATTGWKRVPDRGTQQLAHG